MDPKMELEWEAWRGICACLEDLGIDINEQDSLAYAIKYWGGLYHILREGQKCKGDM